jgi:hypothetical protein
LSKLRYLFLTSNRVRKQGIDALKKAKCGTRLCNLHLDDLKDFIYQDDDDDQAVGWDDLEMSADDNIDGDDD